MPEIQRGLPQGLEANIAYDATEFINASIWEVGKTLLEAALIVIVVIFLFLGNFRSTIIPVVTIPLSLVGVALVLVALRLFDQPADACWPWCWPSAWWSTTRSWWSRTSTATSKRA